MLPYRAVFHKALCARMVHTTCCNLRKKGPQYDAGMEMLVKSMKLPEEQLENLNYDDVDDMFDQNTNSVNTAMHAIPEDLKKEKRFIMGKRIEQKYFKDQYKIKPGEVYNRNKDPFFKKRRDGKDFHHKHHNSIRREAILAEKTPKSFAIDDILTQNKYQQNPLNPLSFIESADPLKVTKGSFKYTSVKPSLSSPDEAYHSTLNKIDPDLLSTGRSNLLTECRPFSDHTSKVPKLIAAAAEFAKRPAEEEPSDDSSSDYNGPCLMLWSMKEQMRYLHDTDPLYWSPEMLSAHFPVSPDNAKKLLKSRWVPENEREVARHDNSVLNNWKQLSGGKLRSHALVTKAIQNRLQTSNKPVGGLPVPSAINDQMMNVLDKLQFEHPEQAKKQGVSPVSRPHNDPPEYGYFADIVKNYKAKVDSLHNQASGDDEASTGDLYSSELDVMVTLPSPPSYEGRAVTVRGVATSPEVVTERHQRAASSEEPREWGFLSHRQQYGDRARSQRPLSSEAGNQPLRDRMHRSLLQHARPGLERLKLMEEEDRLEFGVGDGSGHGQHGRPRGVGEAVSVGRHGRPQRGDSEAVTDAQPGARHNVVEMGVGEHRKDRQPRNKKLQADMITYDQFVKQRGKESHHIVDNTDKKQDGYFDLKNVNFLFSSKQKF